MQWKDCHREVVKVPLDWMTGIAGDLGKETAIGMVTLETTKEEWTSGENAQVASIDHPFKKLDPKSLRALDPEA